MKNFQCVLSVFLDAGAIAPGHRITSVFLVFFLMLEPQLVFIFIPIDSNSIKVASELKINRSYSHPVML